MTSPRTCEVPGCNLPAIIKRVQRSGDGVWVCGQPHVYSGERTP
jgi:hypothetical protein